MSQGRAAPLFVQVLGLVIVSLIAAHVISLLILSRMPPAPPEAYRLSEVASALRAPGVTEASEGRPLVTRFRQSPPPRQFMGRRRPGPSRSPSSSGSSGTAASASWPWRSPGPTG